MKIFIYLFCLINLITNYCFAQTSFQLPYQFRNGTAASLLQVNKNFNLLAEKTSEVSDGQYYRLKVYENTPPAADCDEEHEKGRLVLISNGVIQVCLDGWVSVTPAN